MSYTEIELFLQESVIERLMRRKTKQLKKQGLLSSVTSKIMRPLKNETSKETKNRSSQKSLAAATSAYDRMYFGSNDLNTLDS